MMKGANHRCKGAVDVGRAAAERIMEAGQLVSIVILY